MPAKEHNAALRSAFELARCFNEFVCEAEGQWLWFLPQVMEDRRSRRQDEPPTMRELIGCSFLDLDAAGQTAASHKVSGGRCPGKLFREELAKTWEGLEKHFLSPEHRRQLDDLDGCDPESEFAFRRWILQQPPWASVSWRELEVALRDLVRALPPPAVSCFNMESVLSSARLTLSSLLLPAPPLIVDAEFPTDPVWMFDGRKAFLHGGVLPMMARMLPPLRAAFPLLHKWDIDISEQRYKDTPATAECDSYPCWAIERLSEIEKALWAELDTQANGDSVHGGAAVNDEATDEWPPDDRWHFQSGRTAFGHHVFVVTGKELSLLETLAKARRPLTKHELIDAVWGDDGVEETTFRSTLSHVRSLLRQEFALTDREDPIPQVDHRRGAPWHLDCPLLRTALSRKSG